MLPIDQFIRLAETMREHALLVQAQFPRAYREGDLFVAADVVHHMCNEVQETRDRDGQVCLRAGMRLGPVIVWRSSGHSVPLIQVLENLKTSTLVGQAALLEAIGKVTES